MANRTELAAAANRSFVGSYRTLTDHCSGGETFEGPGLFAFVTGLPFSFFNGCVVVQPTRPARLDAALDWLASRGLPHRLWIDEVDLPGLREVALGHGFQQDERRYPGMVLGATPDAPPPPDGVTVDPVTDAGLDAFRAVLVEGGMDPASARQMFSESFAGDPDVQLFVGCLDGVAVGTSVAIRTGDVSGVYAVGTRPAARRRGVGTALSWAAVAAGREWRCETTVLQASEMGYPIYAAMGFRTVVRYAQFAKTAPGPPSG